MSMLKLSDLDRINPRYLSEAQRRLRDGRYPDDSSLADFMGGPPLPRLRIRRELSEAELAEGARLAREGASIRRIVRELNLTRATAYGIYREHRPEEKARAMRPAHAEAPAPAEPVIEAEPAATVEPVSEPAPASDPAPPAFDWDAYRKAQRR